MKRKFLAKAITLGLMLAVPLGVEAVNVTTEVNNETVTVWGGQTVISGGVTNGTIVDNGLENSNNACQVVGEGGIANDTVLKAKESTATPGARQNIETGGTANRTKIEKNGRADLHGGTAVGLVNDGGSFQVASGKATDTVLNSGSIKVEAEKIGGKIQKGAVLENTTINDGALHIVTITIDNIKYDSEAIVKGTTMNRGQISIDGSLSKLENTIINDGSLTVNDGIVDTTTANGGNLEIYNGIITNTELKNIAKMTVHDGTSNISGLKLSDTSMVTAKGGTLTNVELYNNTKMYLTGGNTKVNNVSVTGEASDRTSSISTKDGAKVDGLTLNSYGISGVEKGGTVNNVTIKSKAWQGAYEGGTATNVTIEAGGRQTMYENNTRIRAARLL